MGLTPPHGGPKDIWVDMKKALDNAQLVSIFSSNAPSPLLLLLFSDSGFRNSWVRLCITKVNCLTSKQSTKKR